MSQRSAKPVGNSSPKIDWSKPVELVPEGNRPEQYHQFETRSRDAIYSALGAKRPLLVRGKPGVGKTQLAEAAAHVLKRRLVRHVVSSQTESRDLLWHFDAVMRLAEAQIASAIASAGRVVRSGDSPTGDEPEVARKRMIKRLRNRLDVRRFLCPGPLWWAFDWESARDQAKRSRSPLLTAPEGGDELAENGWVVLIDEIDKADIDVPNGLLEALGSWEFPVLGSRDPVKLKGEPPLVIITTNEERTLPNAFVRRCLVLTLALPEADEKLVEFLVKRASVHFQERAKSEPYLQLFEEAARMLVKDRATAKEQSAEPLPGQAEYLDLLRAVFDRKPDTIKNHQQILDSVAEFTLRKHDQTPA
jgi:MoxR-like ATPase